MSFFEPKTQKNQGLPTFNAHHEQGSALIWIMVMVSLFAALGYAVSQGSRGGTSDLTEKQAELAATEILEYATQIKNTVRMLLINGCNDTEISFDQAVVSGYSNPNAPSDESCHVYSANGGAMRYQPPLNDWLDNAQSSTTHYGEWFTNANLWVVGVGTDGSGSACSGGASDGSCRELVTGIPFLKYDVCRAVNKALRWGTDSSGTPIQDNGFGYAHNTHIRFQGIYGSGNQIGLATPASDNYSGIFSGCIEGHNGPTTGTYHFFQVLIAR